MPPTASWRRRPALRLRRGAGRSGLRRPTSTGTRRRVPAVRHRPPTWPTPTSTCRRGTPDRVRRPDAPRRLDLTPGGPGSRCRRSSRRRYASSPHDRRDLTVHPVPAMGAEDVLVAARPAPVFTGTEDGAIWRLTRRRPRTAGSPTPVAARSASRMLPDGRLLVCDADRGPAAGRPGHRRRRGARRRGRRRADAVLQQRRRGRRRHRSASATPPPLPPSSTGRPTSSSHPHRPAAAPRSGRHGRGRARRPRVRQRGRARLRRVVRRGRRDRRRAPSSATGWPARAPARATTSSPTCPGYPDNIARGSDGLIWVTIASPVDPSSSGCSGAPAAAPGGPGSPSALQPKPSPDRTRAGVRRRRPPGARPRPADDARLPHGDRRPGARRRLWLGSLHEPAVAVVDRP